MKFYKYYEVDLYLEVINILIDLEMVPLKIKGKFKTLP